MKTNKILCGIVLLFISGCDQHKAVPSSHQDDSAAVKTEQTENHNATALTLNEGQRWKLDEPTHANINAIKQVYEKAAKETGPDYAVLAGQLQAETDKLISECKMSGKDHDMLHLWLGEYLSTLRELKTSEAEGQKAAFYKIGEQLKSFDQYFE